MYFPARITKHGGKQADANREAWPGFSLLKTEKSPSYISDRLVSGNVQLQRALNLAAAQAAGADVDVLRSAVDDGLDALHVRLPGTVGASVGVADLDAEGNTLVTELTLCHI